MPCVRSGLAFARNKCPVQLFAARCYQHRAPDGARSAVDLFYDSPGGRRGGGGIIGIPRRAGHDGLRPDKHDQRSPWELYLLYLKLYLH